MRDRCMPYVIYFDNIRAHCASDTINVWDVRLSWN